MSSFKKRAVVTGGAGFIGSHLVDRLAGDGWNVIVVDNLSTGLRKNIGQNDKKVTLLKGSITDRDFLDKVVEKGDTIWHLAAMNSVPKSIKYPWETNETNVTGTLNLLLAAKDKKARRVIYSASSSAYGDSVAKIKAEDLPAKPLSPYGLSKYTGEEYCRIFSSVYGISTVSLRYFNVFGPRQNPNSPYAAVVPLFIQALIKNTPITVFGDGEQSRDFTYVQNVVEANYLAGLMESINPGSYNVGCGDSISINQVISLIEHLSGHKFKVQYKNPRVGDVRTSRASVDKIFREVDFKPLVKFEEGLKIAIEWYSSNQSYFTST